MTDWQDISTAPRSSEREIVIRGRLFTEVGGDTGLTVNEIVVPHPIHIGDDGKWEIEGDAYQRSWIKARLWFDLPEPPS